MVSLRFYGGVSEIGGNKILIEDGGERILFDFGSSFSPNRYALDYFDYRSYEELIEFGMIPAIEGAYDADNLLSGVFISHPHSDHYGLISRLNRRIPLYMGKLTHEIIKARDETYITQYKCKIGEFKVKTYSTGDRVKIGPIEVEPIHVDHSAPGSYGFIIHTTKGAIVYTGDFRMHGPAPQMTQDFIDRASEEKPIAMITEGTNIMNADNGTEQEVLEKANKVVSSMSGIVFAEFGSADLNRLQTYLQVAEKSGRNLILSTRHAYVLHSLAGKCSWTPDASSSLIKIYAEKQPFYSWEKELYNSLDNIIGIEELEKMQGKSIFVNSVFRVTARVMADLVPGSESCYIHSISEHFTEGDPENFEVMQNWMEKYGLPYYQIHCSGHMMPHELKDAIKKIKPNQLFPVHTDRPQIFSSFVKGHANEIVLPELEKEYSF